VAPADLLDMAMQVLIVHNSRVHRVVLTLYLDSSLASMHHRLTFYRLRRGEFPFSSEYVNPTMQNCLSEAPPAILRIRYTVVLIFLEGNTNAALPRQTTWPCTTQIKKHDLPTFVCSCMCMGQLQGYNINTIHHICSLKAIIMENASVQSVLRRS
jgi:hypothetical protein